MATLGKASLVLTADNTGLDAGLSKAKRDTSGFFGRMGRTLTPGQGGQGALNRFIFGTPEHDAKTGEYLGRIGGIVGKFKGMAGGVAAAAGVAAAGLAIMAAGAVAVAVGLKKAAETALRLAETGKFANGTLLNSDQLAAVKTMQTAVNELQTAWEEVAVALAPVITLIAGYLLDAFDLIKPYIQPLIDGFAQVAQFIGAVAVEAVQLATEVIDWIQNVAQSVADWITELLGLESVHVNFENVVKAILKSVAYYYGLVWDSVKAGAGVVALVAGKIVGAFGKVVDALSEVVALAKRLPDEIRPDWVGKFADGVAEFGAATVKSGAELEAWGRKQIDAWGSSFKSIDEWFAKLDGKKRAFAAKPVEINYVAVGAFDKGSREAASIEQRFKFENLMKDDAKKKAEKLDEKKVKLLEGIDKKLADAGVIRVAA